MAVSVSGTGSGFAQFSGTVAFSLTNNAGDFGMVIITGDNSGGGISGITPGTWTQIYQTSIFSVDGQFAAVWQCTNLTGAATYTATLSGSAPTDVSAVAIAISGDDTITPVNVSDITISDSSHASDWLITAPSLNTTVDGCLLVAMFAADPNSGSFGTTVTAPVGYGGATSEHATAAWSHCGLAYTTQTTKGITGTATFTVAPSSSANAAYIAYHFAIAPAVGVSGTAFAAISAANLQRKRVLLPPIFRG